MNNTLQIQKLYQTLDYLERNEEFLLFSIDFCEKDLDKLWYRRGTDAEQQRKLLQQSIRQFSTDLYELKKEIDRISGKLGYLESIEFQREDTYRY